MKKTKTLIAALLFAAATVAISNAQLVLTDFSDYVNDANNFTGSGTLYSDTNWDSAVTQGTGVATFTAANELGGMTFYFDGTTTNAFAAYTQIGLTGNLTGGGITINFLAADYITTLASVSWTDADISGSESIKAISIPLNVGGFSLRYNGSPSGTLTGSLDNLSLIAVPEPSTYALLILGAGAIVVMVRRRRTA